MSDWTPEFDGQRPPFVDGNGAAVKHGAYARPLLEGRAAEVAEWFRRIAPAVTEADEPLLALAAMAYTRAEFANAALARIDEAVTEPLSAYAMKDPERLERLRQDARAWFRQAKGFLEALAMSQPSRASLGLQIRQLQVDVNRLDEGEQAQLRTLLVKALPAGGRDA